MLQDTNYRNPDFAHILTGKKPTLYYIIFLCSVFTLDLKKCSFFTAFIFFLCAFAYSE